MLRSIRQAIWLVLLPATLAGAASPPTFEQHIRPILKAYCLDCHGGAEQLQGNLDLRLKRFIVTGGDGGPALIHLDPAASPLIARMKSGEMPPTEKKVPAEQIALIQAWIAAGAPTLRDEPEQLPTGIEITPEERAFWSFQPLRRPAVPSVSAASHNLLETPIDAFVLAKLQEEQLLMSSPADRLTLLRRASQDLLGLPPSNADLETFLADQNPDAYERQLDRLLASPHYGERWGRHWLDVAGFAESDGDGNQDTLRPFAWHYRDYVIRALNADTPFDRFLLEQLAGDELIPQPWNNLAPEQIDTLAATGFLRTVIDATQGTPMEGEAANQVVADTIKVVGSAVYGLTIGCAQCHDHRYDPIPHTDYFRLRAILEPALNTASWRRPNQRLVSLYTDTDRAKVAEINAALTELQNAYNDKEKKYVTEAFETVLTTFPEDLRPKLKEAYEAPGDKRTDEQKQLLSANPKVNLSPGILYQYNQKAADELKADQSVIQQKAAQRPVEDFIPVLNEVAGQVPATFLFYRGDYRQPKQQVTPGDLTIAAGDGSRLEIPEPAAGAPSSNRRTVWSKHLTDGKHLLVGRVLANRLWFHHFGRGIVDTPGDFGMLGVRPTHPELLDWLATEVPRLDWSWKRSHRLIMTSAVYRQSATPLLEIADRARQLDSQNAWYARFPLQRLDAESLRDRLLIAAGRFDDRLFGPSLPVEDDFVGQVVVKDDQPRRSIYVQVRRSKPLSLLTTFDAPQMMLNCERRIPSTGAPQALMLMNSDVLLKHSELVARRSRIEIRQRSASLAAQSSESPADATRAVGHPTLVQQVAQTWQLVYQRSPEPAELDAACAFLNEQLTTLASQSDVPDRELTAVTSLCQQLLSSNEFLYVD